MDFCCLVGDRTISCLPNCRRIKKLPVNNTKSIPYESKMQENKQEQSGRKRNIYCLLRKMEVE